MVGSAVDLRLSRVVGPVGRNVFSLSPPEASLASLNLEQMRSRAHLSPSSSSPSPLALTLPPSWNATPCSCTILPRIVLVIRLCLQPVAKVVEGNAYPST